jgi:hypothetical protein
MGADAQAKWDEFVQAHIRNALAEYTEVISDEVAAWLGELAEEVGKTTGTLERRINELATARTFNIVGTYDAEKTYQALDVVALNSSWFVAKRDNPGPCPGDGWQAGPSGRRGPRGEAADNVEVRGLRDEVKTLRDEVRSMRAILEGKRNAAA